MLIHSGSSEAQASFTLFSLFAPHHYHGEEAARNVPVQAAELSSCREISHGSIMGSFFQQQIYCRQTVPGDSAGVPCPPNPCPDTTTTAGPITEQPNLPKWDEAIVCACKSKSEGSPQEYHRRNPPAAVITSVRISLTLIHQCHTRILALCFSCCSNTGKTSIAQTNS